MTSISVRKLITAAGLVVAAGALGACASIPQRAFDNGRAMSQSRAYQAALWGDMSIRTQRELRMSADARRIGYREAAYPAFGDWWW